MPEGDTIFRTAERLRHAFAGREVTRFESAYPKLTRVDEDAPLRGRTIEDVRAAGKHLLIVFSGDLVLRSHLRMHGSWHLYRTTDSWRRSLAAMRILIETREFVAVAFDVVDVSFHTPRNLLRDSRIGSLGPDVLDAGFDESEALRRLRLPPDLPIAAALLEQWRMAGIGNVYKSETLFLCRTNPFQPVSQLTDDRLLALVRKAVLLMRSNVAEGTGAEIVTYRSLRRTTGRANPGERYWVYRRIGLPCRRCGTRIESLKMGDAARSTYFCPACQLEPSAKIFGITGGRD